MSAACSLEIVKDAKMSYRHRRINLMILLHGPPGTGKTTLCHGLVQKVSIRLSTEFPSTQLIEIRASELHSHYYSESAKQITALFLAIQQLSLADPTRVIVVLIDEVEGLVRSRKTGLAHGEVEDSLRATNAVLTGFDQLRSCSNVLLLCTTNLIDCLDPAFLDRCSIKRKMPVPTERSAYRILCTGINELVHTGRINVDDEADSLSSMLPTYDEAVLFAQTDDVEYTGFKLLEILKCLRIAFPQGPSGRYLSPLPQRALLMYMRNDRYTLDHLLRDMIRVVKEEVECNMA